MRIGGDGNGPSPSAEPGGRSGAGGGALAVALRSIGCRTNQEESAALRAEFLSVGCSVVDNIEKADIVIVNTCSVTAHAESKTRRFIQSLSSLAPAAKILVTGCFAQQHGAAIQKCPGVKWVVGNADKHRIPSIIAASGGGTYLSGIDTGSPVFWGDKVIDPAAAGRTRFSLKIQEGCDFKCAYCIVPSLRGPSRSAPKNRLVDTFKKAVDKGYKEIVLTGTHIGQYRQVVDGDDFSSVQLTDGAAAEINVDKCVRPQNGDRTGGLEALLNEFLKVEGDYRIRLSSLDPRDLTDTLMAMVGENPKVCDHLHVSVQSMSAEVLALMDRPYGGLDLLTERLRGFREKYPAAGLGADFIVGHPGESDAMFEAALRRVSEVGFTYGHVFRYSKRFGAKAAKMPGQIAESVKKRRSAALLEALQKSRENFLSLLFARPLYIIVESEVPVSGVTGNYIRTEVPGAAAARNTWMRVVLTGGRRGGYCVAERSP
ncbi:tRNA (N(6)-L-threonylcarbamoyladenosine(37)-C(2))-methylthiotransferase [Fibrobacteres bacterium R8-0-B4]